MRIKDEDRLTLDSKNYYTDKELTAIIMLGNNDNENDNRIGVYIPKLMPNIIAPNGAAEVKEEIDDSKLANSKNRNIGSKSLYVRNYTMCMPMVSPGETIPNYSKNEKVNVRFLDQDINTLYMVPYSMFNSQNRKNDRKTLFVPATPEEQTPLNETNTYRIDANSINKRILIETSQANGEDYIYRILIDTANNNISINDDKRRIEIISDQDMVSIQNEAGSIMTIKNNKIDLQADNINLHAKTKLQIKSPDSEFVLDNLKETIDTYKGNIDNSTIIGTSLKKEYSQMKYNGDLFHGSFQKVKYTDTPLFGISGTLTANKWFTGTNAGDQPTGGNAGGDTNGGFDMAASGSRPVAIAQVVTQCLNAIAQNVDILYGAIMGATPTIPALNGLVGQIPSQKLRG